MTSILRLLLLSCLLLPGARLLADPAAGGNLALLRIDAAITPVVADFVDQQLQQANQRQDRGVLIELNTPGGLDTAMRQMIQGILNSEIPVIVYVAPAGARAASAGALITFAADFAAMAPGTNIGAAHPVSIGSGGKVDETMQQKVQNDAAAYARSLAQQRGRNADWAEKAVRESASISASEALEQGVIDLIASDSADLLRQLDGLTYLRGGQQRQIATADAQLVQQQMTWRQEVLSALSNPTFAYLLMMLGILGIFFEISQPGVILPGVIGAIAILLAFFAFSTLPINYVGLLLILLAVILFILEVKVPSYGMLTVGGLVAMALGSLMLIDSDLPYLQISRAAIAATMAVSAGFILFATGMVVRTQRQRVTSGLEGMVGEEGEAISDLDPEGKVFVHGEYWSARAAAPIPAGTKIVVRGAQGLTLEVSAHLTNDKRGEH